MNVLYGRGQEKALGMRPVSLLLTTVFAVCSFALMWAAVSCLNRINQSYSAASDGLAAAQFTANKIRSAEGMITVYSREDGVLEKMVISRGDGYENVISFWDGSLSEALIPEGSGASRGEGIFEVGSVAIEGVGEAAKITVSCGSGECAVIAAPGSQMQFLAAEGAQ